MNEVLDKLMLLQEIFSQKILLEKQSSDMKEEFVLKKKTYERVIESYDKKMSQLEEYRDKLSHDKIQLNDIIERYQAAEKTIIQVNSQKEYEAVEKTMKELIKEETELRKSVQKLTLRVDELEEESSSLKEMEVKDKVEIQEYEEKMHTQMATYQKQIQEYQEKEIELTQVFGKNILFKFERIVRHKNLGIVNLRKGVCQGCFMQLPFHFINRVRSQKDIEFCPYCSRILYYEDDELSNDEVIESSLSDLFEEGK